MDAANRTELIAHLEGLRQRLETVADDEPAPIYSQRWVDRRRVLLAEETLGLVESLLGGEAVDARMLAEQLQAVIRRAHDIAPGFGMLEASDLVLDALARGSNC